MSTRKQPPVLGIDLGTSTCLACVQESDAGEPTMIQPDRSFAGDAMPSYFCLTEDGPVVGERARQKIRDRRYAKDVVRCVKRAMGEPDLLFRSSGESFSPVEISAHYLRQLKQAAEGQLGLPAGAITEAVVTVPAYFGSLERMFTRDAADKAGFAKVHLLDEPIAAAYGLGLHQRPGKQTSLVVDLGGGTLDVTLLLAGASVPQGLDELGRDGDAELGGDKWDYELAKLLVFKQNLDCDSDFFEWNNIDLYEPCEIAKRRFSDSDILKQMIRFDSVQGGIHQSHAIDVTADEYRRHTEHLADRCARICERLIQNIAPADAERARRRRPWWKRLGQRRAEQLSWADIDQIYLVGGGSKVSAVKAKIAQLWGRAPELARHPQHQVARGAGRIAREVGRNEKYFDEMHLRSPYAYGYFYYPDGKHQPPRFKPVIERNQRIPASRTAVCAVGDPHAASFAVQIVEERLKMREVINEPYAERRTCTLRIADLPRNRAAEGEFVEVSLEYLSDREMAFGASFRGKSMKIRPDPGMWREYEPNGSGS